MGESAAGLQPSEGLLADEDEALIAVADERAVEVVTRVGLDADGKLLPQSEIINSDEFKALDELAQRRMAVIWASMKLKEIEAQTDRINALAQEGRLTQADNRLELARIQLDLKEAGDRLALYEKQLGRNFSNNRPTEKLQIALFDELRDNRDAEQAIIRALRTELSNLRLIGQTQLIIRLRERARESGVDISDIIPDPEGSDPGVTQTPFDEARDRAARRNPNSPANPDFVPTDLRRAPAVGGNPPVSQGRVDVLPAIPPGDSTPAPVLPGTQLTLQQLSFIESLLAGSPTVNEDIDTLASHIGEVLQGIEITQELVDTLKARAQAR